MPLLFRAREDIIKFCKELRLHKNLQTVKSLPQKTSSNYSIVLYEPLNLRKDNRVSYSQVFPLSLAS